MSGLSEFSDAINRASQEQSEKRAAFNDQLKGKEIFFVPFEDAPEGHGVGWFRGDVGFFSYVRYSNGYDPHTRSVLEDSLLLKLIPHLPK